MLGIGAVTRRNNDSFVRRKRLLRLSFENVFELVDSVHLATSVVILLSTCKVDIHPGNTPNVLGIGAVTGRNIVSFVQRKRLLRLGFEMSIRCNCVREIFLLKRDHLRKRENERKRERARASETHRDATRKYI